MHTTSASLLAKLKTDDRQQAWNRFVQIYTPLIFYWARRAGLDDDGAADLVQEVFALLLVKLPEFEYDRQGSFRAWLRTVTMNKWRELLRKGRRQAKGVGDEDLADAPGPDAQAMFEEEEYRRHVVHRAMEIIRPDVEPTTFQACWEYVVKDRPAAEVAQELGITVNSVYLAKSRILRRLREVLDGLLD